MYKCLRYSWTILTIQMPVRQLAMSYVSTDLRHILLIIEQVEKNVCKGISCNHVSMQPVSMNKNVHVFLGYCVCQLFGHNFLLQ